MILKKDKTRELRSETSEDTMKDTQRDEWLLTLEDGTGAEETRTAKTKGKVNLMSCMFAVERAGVDLEKNSEFEKRLNWTSQ